MRLIHLLCFILLILPLAACGTEGVMNPPLFSDVKVSDQVAKTDLLIFSVSNVTISGKIDNPNTKIVANKGISTPLDDVAVPVSSDGSWSFDWTLTDGTNLVALTATDENGNINQMVLSITYDITPPAVASVLLDNSNTNAPKLVIIMNEKINASSISTATFAIDGTVLTPDPIADPTSPVITFLIPLTGYTGTLDGDHTLTYGGLTDLAVPTSNTVAANTTFAFTIQTAP